MIRDSLVLWASVTFYDQRGGGIETALKGDKQGLGLTKRNKKRFEAQQMVRLLGSLTHNTIIWARRWLAAPQLRSYGMLRLVRDVFHISGFLGVDARGQIVQIGLNRAAPWLLSSSTRCRSCSLLFTWPFIWTNIPLLQKPWSLICTKFRYVANQREKGRNGKPTSQCSAGVQGTPAAELSVR